MTGSYRELLLRLKIVLARIERRLGWPGAIGVMLTAASLAVLAWSRPFPTDFGASDAAALDLGQSTAHAPQTVRLDVPALPAVADVPLSLTRIQRAAVEQGLGWPRADYRLNAATGDTPASVDVHCVLKGPYPNVRRFISAILHDAPTLTLREFRLSRPSADVADLEATLSMVLYLSAPSDTAASPK